MKIQKILTGLMGVDSDGTLFHPDGTRLVKLPLCISRHVQILQHYFARDVNGNWIKPLKS